MIVTRMRQYCCCQGGLKLLGRRRRAIAVREEEEEGHCCQGGGGGGGGGDAATSCVQGQWERKGAKQRTMGVHKSIVESKGVRRSELENTESNMKSNESEQEKCCERNI